jgi:hypothetical protein
MSVCVLILAAEIMYVTASTPEMNFNVALDKSNMRMMAISMPNTLSFGNILTGLNVPSAAAWGDIVTISSTSVVYVPTVVGVTGGLQSQLHLCRLAESQFISLSQVMLH